MLNKYNVDLNAVLVKPLYFGLLMNIFVPATLLLIAYFIEQGKIMERKLSFTNGDLLFWILLVMAVADGAMAVFMRQRLFFRPMIRTKETFANDLTAQVFKASIICYAITTAIAIYGFALYMVSGGFDRLFLFIFISFIAFQIIRPRHGFLKKVIEAQGKHVDERRYATPPK
ncbi:MAG: hypothetical protein JW763_09550 [candidate division Zixibacteria bacterium]|nr:hypothetical protein [candidate division Zixibacteria bacterium]